MDSKAASRSAASREYRAGRRGALGQYRWENRVLTVFAPDSDGSLYRRQQESLRLTEPGAYERDVVVISVLGEIVATRGGQAVRASAPDLRDAYDVLPHHFRVVPIGKDGAVKLRQEEPVSAAELFVLIDAMPMRKHEMRSRRQ